MKTTIHKYLFFILLYSVMSGLTTFGQLSEFHAQNFTIEDGLSHNRVASIAQDYNGFLWFATENGINRNDGYNFERIYPQSSNELHINCPSIESIFTDSRKNIWIGTKSGGVNRYDLVHDAFTNYPYCLNDSLCLSDQRAIAFCEDKKGNIWIGTWGGGINRYNVQTNTFKHYLYNRENLIEGNISDIVCTENGDIWAAGYFGLWKFNATLDSFEKIPVTGIDEGNEGYMGFVKVVKDKYRNKLWLGTWGRGLVEFDMDGRKFTSHLNPPDKLDINASFSNVYSILPDDEGNLWIGTWGNGLWNYNVEKQTFKRVKLERLNNYTNFVILDIFDDGQGNVWVGTNNSGIIRLNKKLPFQNVLMESENTLTITLSILQIENNMTFVSTLQDGLMWKKGDQPYQKVFTENNESLFESNLIYKNKDDKIWVSGNNLYEIQWKNNVPVLVPCSEMYNNPLLNIDKVTSIVENGNLVYIGTKQNSLYVFSKANDQYSYIKTFEVNPEINGYLQNGRISYLYLDRYQHLWVGTYGGIHLITNNFNVYTSREIFKEENNLTCDIITCINEDKNGRILISTPCGLNVLTEYEKMKYKIRNITTQDGLPEDFIYSILIDGNDNLWVNTNNSIVNLDIDSNIYISYYNHNGIDLKNFETGCYKNEQGELFFCGAGGYVKFLPQKIKKENYVKKLAISSLRVLNTEIKPGKIYNNRLVLENSINELNQIRLNHKEKEFSFIISFLDYHNPTKHHYSYKLNNYNENWVYTGTRRHISFSNLKPGKYSFNARASSNDGQWYELENPIEIIISPPWFQTWWAYLMFIALVMSIVLVIRQNAIKQMRLQRNIELLQIKNDQEQKMNELKFRFFTNISHEFVTPLTLILGPIKELYDKSEQFNISENFKSKIQVIGKNANRLLRLINQLLDFRKTETSKMELKAQKTDIIEFMDEISLSFTELTKQNNIRFIKKFNLVEKEIWCDRDKLEIIINNLLSNAIKYIKDEGEIKLSVEEEAKLVYIRIIDNGIGIPEGESDKIFERFYQIERIQNYGSAGIGLALVKRFVELHSGKISVKSIPNEKTEFTIQLPKGDGHLKENEKYEHTAHVKKSRELFDYPLMMQKIKPSHKNSLHNDIKILVVEDNEDVRNYLEDLLGPYYIVLQAVDGQMGFDKAVELLPDLILSDIMMPNMDGFELCQKLRNHKDTKLIPVILLTAKSAENYAVFGLKSGADDYISKPFDPELLLEKVSNLLYSRKLLKENYSKRVKVAGTEIEITPFDEKLINNCIILIEKNFLNPQLDADFLASEFNMSRSSLYRKLKGITGYSINHFIRKIRLDRAVQLLEDNEKTITEIAYEVGFNDLKYFRESFIKQFGATPTKYRKGEIENIQ